MTKEVSNTVQNKIVLVLAAILAVLVLGSSIIVASASRASGQTSDSVCYQVDAWFINGQTTPTKTIDIDIPAGVYDVLLATYDSYPDRSNSDPALQQSERVSVYGVTSVDLTDGIESAAEALRISGVTFDHHQDSVTINHVYRPDGLDSVRVPQICYYDLGHHNCSGVWQIDDCPEPTTTTAAPTTTTPPLTEVPTTIELPTTEPPQTPSTVVETLPETPPAQPIPEQPKYNG